ncbi:hypothetical protein PABG_03324 [Paracoccidioides brasiliensis Pb03]|uniref:Uncharacterized protein n=2 Tax=Paracoccidioides brasiliensis TaxID=121759 RepID=C1G4M1_PARBD|nr:uncharacterized protein PADG_01887 [Paracoccidioides brasiliensis Pb18]EEH21093.2 hypothetical protein PABG_03324 [Paracoccidioides brasiliensis Pb03]EEH45737.2 hypothetical protein PADG_01887 [Paracoccidioides brasiliensis Pb18]ODH44688.1 hypothetical protein ACO22_00845 [Paracoccidioides brasiliensis]
MGAEWSFTPATLHSKTGDVDIDIKLVSDWDLASVAVRPDPTLSKLGLATQCISRLEQDLLERLARAEKEK